MLSFLSSHTEQSCAFTFQLIVCYRSSSSSRNYCLIPRICLPSSPNIPFNIHKCISPTSPVGLCAQPTRATYAVDVGTYAWHGTRWEESYWWDRWGCLGLSCLGIRRHRIFKCGENMCDWKSARLWMRKVWNIAGTEIHSSFTLSHQGTLSSSLLRTLNPWAHHSGFTIGSD